MLTLSPLPSFFKNHLQSKERLIRSQEAAICSSALIEKDRLAEAKVYEIEDGVLVSKRECQHCRVNCPKKTNYRKPPPFPLPARYKNFFW